ncbi:PTS sugar transporter subunit IIC [Limosilactobacillus caecicola]|uniref:PTS sugar transporter subunit IIC n=1 Tax=Limosilactobacillus caecicola TaxID=2941332 RepID=UPI00203AD160|nr:PTS sugar transporter subunit IIC [Limosilactobacillus caecicola]
MKIKPKSLVMATLNGNAIAIIIALIPSALLSQVLQFCPTNTFTTGISHMINLAQTTFPFIAAFAVGMILKFSTLQVGSMALATFVAAGNATPQKSTFLLSGSGVILNIMLTTLIASVVVILLDHYLGQFKMILESLLVLLIAGGISMLTMPVMVGIQNIIGQVVQAATEMSPLLMGTALGILFAVLIVSPISSVAIAMAISLSGVGSGAANAGIVACSFTLAWMGASVNPVGGTLLHFLGSPKVQMANMLEKPKLFIPVILASGITGFFATLCQMGGTPFSAGFGFAGLIGPLTAYQHSTGPFLIGRVLLCYVVIPLLAAWLMNLIFVKRSAIIEPHDLKLQL